MLIFTHQRDVAFLPRVEPADFERRVLPELFGLPAAFDGRPGTRFAPFDLLAVLLDDFFVADFLVGRPDDFFDAPPFDDETFFDGTFAPALRASESPMAMACLRLVTFFPLPPLFNFPSFISCITSPTLSWAFF